MNNLGHPCKQYIEVFTGGHSWAPKGTLENAFNWVEKYFFVNMKVNKSTLPYTEQRVRKMIEDLDSCEGIKKIILFEKINQIVKKQRLKFTDIKLSDIAKNIKTLSRSKELKNEIKFLKYYEKVLTVDDPPSPKNKFISLSSRIKSWGSLNKKYPNNLYFPKIENRITSLTNEFNSKK